MASGETAYVIGVGSTRFKRWPDRGFRDLAGEVSSAALADAGLTRRGEPVPAVWFGNCAMGVWGQANIRGQVALADQQREGRIAPRAPIVNVEGGCATGSLAFRGAMQAVLAGAAPVALAVGVEKVFVPDDPIRTFGVFEHGIDRLHESEWRTFFDEAGARGGVTMALDPRRILFLDVHALLARHHMACHGTTLEEIAAVASKNHHHGSLNPKAQYRFEISAEEVLADKPVVAPLTRSMCAPVSDGAAAAVVCSAGYLAGCAPEVRERAVAIRACALTGGSWRELDERSVTWHASQAAYEMAALRPDEIDFAEVHDATAPCEILHSEDLGFCARGGGGAYAASGATTLGGARPINPSGGLASKGHPLGATGLGMIDEAVTQLRGDAGDRQVAGSPRYGLTHNAGGLVGFDEALCAVTILERP